MKNINEQFFAKTRNATITSAAIKLFHKVLVEHLESLSEEEGGTRLGNYLYKDMKEVISDPDVPNELFSVFLHSELMDTIKDWTKAILTNNHITFDNELEETFANLVTKELKQ